ncbi:MAG: AAA family ATPase [Planctomycetia bacterium]|nr:AAA family ATPase [Planctomycetia bacterium]
MPFFTEKEYDLIYISQMQKLEDDYSCRFDPEVIALLKRLTSIFEPLKARPGAVCSWLHTLASIGKNQAKNKDGSKIEPAEVLDIFKNKTGMGLSIFSRDKLSPSYRNIKEWIGAKLFGQDAAVEKMANFSIRSQMLLNDMDRPLFSMLFVGPTGVGKTESAKQLASIFFGSEDRLIRFDTNELTTAASVSALIGNSFREGSLTGRIRMNPYCVLLFDEIEKAHPSLHDLLLQVLGEGRLTDGKGQLVSFSQCIIILTSNLGASEAEKGFGFRSDELDHSETYIQAVQEFFRPEFLNRLDRIIPFRKLSEQDLKNVAGEFIKKLQGREGFARYHCFFEITNEACQWFASRGIDPRWGARKTIRALEKELVVPISAFLAALPGTDDTNILTISMENNKPKFNGQTILPLKKQRSIVLRKNLSFKEMENLKTLIDSSKQDISNFLIDLARENKIDLYQSNGSSSSVNNDLNSDQSTANPFKSEYDLKAVLYHLWFWFDDTFEQNNETRFLQSGRSKLKIWKNPDNDLSIHPPEYFRGGEKLLIHSQILEEGIEDLHMAGFKYKPDVSYNRELLTFQLKQIAQIKPIMKSGIPPFESAVILRVPVGNRVFQPEYHSLFYYDFGNAEVEFSNYQVDLANRGEDDDEESFWKWTPDFGKHFYSLEFQEALPLTSFRFSSQVNGEYFEGFILNGPGTYAKACEVAGSYMYHGRPETYVVLPWPMDAYSNSDSDSQTEDSSGQRKNSLFTPDLKGAEILLRVLKKWSANPVGKWGRFIDLKNLPVEIPEEFLPFLEE